MRIIKFLILFLAFLPTSFLSAQSADFSEENVEDQAPEIIDVPGLRAEFVQFTQDPATKEATFEMKLNSNLDSDRVQVTWTLTTLSGVGARFKDANAAKTLINIQRGQSYTQPITIIPTGKGEVELLGKVESFKAGETFVVTVKKVFASNALGEILPITNEYANARRGLVIRNILIVLVILISLAYLFVRAIKWFKKWLDR